MLKQIKYCFSLLLLASISLLTAFNATAQQSDKSILLKGVGKIPGLDSPKFLCLSFIINDEPQIIATAQTFRGQQLQCSALISSRLGKGKVLVFSSSDYFKDPMLQNKAVRQLLNNSVDWGKKQGKRKVQVLGEDKDLSRFLMSIKNTRLLKNGNAVNPYANIIFLTHDVVDTPQQKPIEKFVRNGGTIIYGSPLANMQNASPDVEPVHWFSAFLFKAGIFEKTFPHSPHVYNAAFNFEKAPSYLSIGGVINDFKNNTYPPASEIYENSMFFYTLNMALSLSDSTAKVISQLKEITGYNKESLIVPTPGSPVEKGKSGNYVKYYLQQVLIDKELESKPNPHYIARASKTFPGEVPKQADRISTNVTIIPTTGRQGLAEPPADYFRPYSSGLYVAAGEEVTISLPAEDTLRHIQAQIGVHNDDINNLDVITREGHDLTKVFELGHKKTTIYSPYGGILWIRISDTTSLKQLNVGVKGAVKYPYFKLGETQLSDWVKSIKNYPGPWAELASDKIILTVPSARIRDLNDPERVLKFWDSVMDTDAALADISTQRGHPERIIVDQQPAYGYMFTIPEKIVVPDDSSCELMLNIDSVQKKGSWGHFHELGHRHQFWGIDFDGLSEVTVNLYTMYVYDKLLHKGIYNHEDMMSRQEVANKVKDYLADKPSFDKWKADPFLALSMYIQLVDAFGWQPIEQVFKTYRVLPKDKYPPTDDARRDYWFKCICDATHKNLSVFFDKWKVPVSSEVKSTVKSYPEWLPAEMQ